MNAGHLAVLAALAAAVGGAVGSFLNVCAWRLPRGESLLRPGSRCPQCRTPIAARDNLPVVGWLALRGRCRSCRRPIPARYPLVEAAVAVLFVGVVLLDLGTGADPFESGPLAVAAVLTYHVALASLAVTVGLVVGDEQRGLLPPPSAAAGNGVAFALLAAVAALAGALGGDLLGSALNALLLTLFVARLVPPRATLGRLY